MTYDLRGREVPVSGKLREDSDWPSWVPRPRPKPIPVAMGMGALMGQARSTCSVLSWVVVAEGQSIVNESFAWTTGGGKGQADRGEHARH